MTMASTESIVIYVGDGVVTEFDYDFRVDAETDFYIVLVDSVTGSVEAGPFVPGEFTATGVGDDDGGLITYPLIGSPIDSTQKIVIRRLRDETQGLDVSAQAAPTVSLETQLDYIVQMIQDLRVDVDRAPKAPYGISFDSETAIEAAETIIDATTQTAAAIHGAAAKNPPVDADEFGIWDSVAQILKKVTWANIKATLNTYFNGLGSITTAAGDLIYGSGAGTLAKLDKGTKGQVLRQNIAETAPEWALAGIKGHLHGLTLSNNAGDATNDIDIAAGECTDSTGIFIISCAAMTKRLDANWGVGTNAGFRYSGAAIANTTYHIYAVWKADGTQDYYADPSAVLATVLGHLQAEAGGGSYAYLRRIGSIIREGGNIVPFVQDSDLFMRKTVVQTLSQATPGNAAISFATGTPSGIRMEALLTVGLVDTAGIDFMYVSDLSLTDSAASTTAAPGFTVGNPAANFYGYRDIAIMTNVSAQARFRAAAGGATCVVRFNSRGWIDKRDRLA